MAVSGAISAVDQALWDIKGKVLDEPVWRLLGGRVRRGVRAMRVLDTGTIDEVNAAGAAAAAGGYTAVKVLLFQYDHHQMPTARRIADLRDRAFSLRATLGPDVDIAVELHRNTCTTRAIRAQSGRSRPGEGQGLRRCARPRVGAGDSGRDPGPVRPAAPARCTGGSSR